MPPLNQSQLLRRHPNPKRIPCVPSPLSTALIQVSKSYANCVHSLSTTHKQSYAATGYSTQSNANAGYSSTQATTNKYGRRGTNRTGFGGAGASVMGGKTNTTSTSNACVIYSCNHYVLFDWLNLHDVKFCIVS